MSPRRRRQRGISVLATGVGLAALIGSLGLTADITRLYISKNELQSFVDASALAAAYELDGTATGLNRARNVAADGPGGSTNPNRWNFGTQTVPAPDVQFSYRSTSGFEPTPFTSANYRFVQVTATANVQLYFLPVLPGIPTSKPISVTAVAGQSEANSLGEGGSPFSPDAHSATDPEFGFTRGQQYTLKWAPPGKSKKPGGRCPGDIGFVSGSGLSDRGYIDIGQGNGNSALHDAIVNNNYNLAQPLVIGSYIDQVSGNKNVPPAIDERFNQDADTSADTYSGYHGNGRRILAVPVNDSFNGGRVVGFAAFFLPSDACGDKNTDPCCAEYIGPAVLQGGHPGASSSAGLYKVMLFR